MKMRETDENLCKKIVPNLRSNSDSTKMNLNMNLNFSETLIFKKI